MTVAVERPRERRVVTTEQLKRLVEAGAIVRLPEVVRPSEETLGHYSDQEQERLQAPAEVNPVVRVGYLRDEPVKCISVDHERHLYVTDDFIPTHNTSNIVFLKSTDDSMIETLSKMSGTRHVAYRDSKTVTKDVERIFKPGSVEGKVSYTMSVKEEPVISYNDMAFISERNSIVFRAGDAPVWNRNEMILPMSFRLFRDLNGSSNGLVVPGKDYSLQTIPTLSSVIDFDVRKNQPDFEQMLEKRMKQAERSKEAREIFMRAYEYSEVDMTRLDPDEASDEIMSLVDVSIDEGSQEPGQDPSERDQAESGFDELDWEANMELEAETTRLMADRADHERKLYADGQVSRADMIDFGSKAVRSGALDREIVEVFKALRVEMQRDDAFSAGSDGGLRSADGTTIFITKPDESESLRSINDAAKDPEATVYAEEDVALVQGFEVHDEFYKYLASLESWHGIARGEFERRMAQAMRMRDAEELVSA